MEIKLIYTGLISAILALSSCSKELDITNKIRGWCFYVEADTLINANHPYSNLNFVEEGFLDCKLSLKSNGIELKERKDYILSSISYIQFDKSNSKKLRVLEFYILNDREKENIDSLLTFEIKAKLSFEGQNELKEMYKSVIENR